MQSLQLRRIAIWTLASLVLALLVVAPTAQGQVNHALPRAPAAQATATPAAPTYAFPVQLTAAGKKKGKISYGKYHHDYPAADIFCPVGSRFVAPISGVVDFVAAEDTWNAKQNDPATRSGLAVAIIGDDGVRYYGSHLSAIAKGIESGARVETGQLLGLTGKSGNARTTPPHLHFGISRPTSPDDWQVRRGELAPFVYLRAWQRGGQARPELP
ncbi:MAG: M23 family metallopeptidase [Roseiflexaceae bacterium]|nr:M23 family metallopeptidase [Roseiflexaceae bacterium]